MFSGMKKFMASKLGDTKIGRAAVLKYTGESGDHTIKSLKSASNKVAGHVVAKDLKKKTMKLVSKIALLYDQKKINEKHIILIQEKMNDFTTKATALFSVDHSSVNEADIKELQGLIEGINSVLKTTVKGLMQPKNVKMFDDIFSFYGSDEFLDRLIHDPDIHGEKASLAVCLRLMANPLEASSMHIPCANQHCDKPRAGVPGSDYCPVHHERKLTELLKDPKPRDFILNDEYRKYFESFMHDEGYTSLMTLFTACESFKKITNRNLLKPRAQNIYIKHFAKGAEQFVEFKEDESAVPEIIEAIDSDAGPSKKVFQRVSALMETRIEIEFKAFLFTDAFNEWKVRCGPEAAKGISFHVKIAEGKYDESDSEHSDSDEEEKKKGI